MHFHLPKPLHGWRAFIGEVGVIVLGVLIALGFGQAASWLDDRAGAAQTRTGIRGEIAENLEVILRRQRTEGCMQRRLREIAAFLDATSVGQHPARPTWIGSPYAPILDDTRFKSAQSAGKFFLLPQNEQQDLTDFYSDSDDFNTANVREWYDWAQLRSLASPDTRLTDTEITRLRQALQDARAADWFIRLDIDQFAKLARTQGVVASKRQLQHFLFASACLPMNMPYAQAAAKAAYAGVPFPE